MELALSVAWLITYLCVFVFKNTLEIPSQIAIQCHHNVRFLLFRNRLVDDFYIWKILAVPSPESDPCNPSPCGPNAQCNAGICTCLPNYQGDPYTSCRPECVLNNDCPLNRACVRNKCMDPCPGTCGRNAICNVLNHIPMCSCPVGMAGNAFISCERIEGMINKKKLFLQKNLKIKKKSHYFWI